MTDESELLRLLIEREVERYVRDMSEGIAQEVLRHLARMGAQVVRLHANGEPQEDSEQ